MVILCYAYLMIYGNSLIFCLLKFPFKIFVNISFLNSSVKKNLR